MTGLLLLVSLARAVEPPEGAVPAAPPPPPTPRTLERLTVDGYLRTRGVLFYNGDLDRGPTPSTGEPVFPISPDDGETIRSSDLRLRVDATLAIVPEVKIHARVDGFDNMVLGSTPVGYPVDRWAPSIYASTSQDPPSSGVNSFGDSVSLKQAWGEADTPFGAFVVGRMSMPAWGLGMLANPGEGLDDDVDENVDRIGFATSLLDHVVGVSWDWNATGPTSATAAGSLWGQDYDLTDADDVNTISATVLRFLDPQAVERRKAAGRAAFTWGTWVTWRTQEMDVPSWWLDGLEAADGEITEEDLVRRDFTTFGADLTLCVEARHFEAAVEGAYLTGAVGNLSLLEGVTAEEVTMDQAGALARVTWIPAPDRLRIGVEGGYASGDDAPGFGVAPPITQLQAQPGDLDGPQVAVPGDTTVDNFRFSPNHHVDLILWRQIVGTFTDGIYLKPGVTFSPHPRLDLSAHLVWSQALYASSTPGNATALGTEVDLGARWRIWEGFQARLDWGLLLPGAGFRNQAADLDPTPAQTVRALVAFTY